MESTATAWLLGGVLVGALFAALGALLLRQADARRWQRGARGLVQAIEQLRRGRGPGRPIADPASPLASVQDAIQRLEGELGRDAAAQKDSADRLHALVQALDSSAVVTLEPDGTVRSFSAGATALFGWTEPEVLGRSAAALFEESSWVELGAELEAREALREGVRRRVVLRRKDGTELRGDASMRPILEHGGVDSRRTVLLVEDVTVQAQLEGELRRSEQRYRSLVEGLAEGVAIVQRGRVLYGNPAFARLCGRDAAGPAGWLLREHLATRDVLLVEERLGSIERGEAERDELRCRLAGAGGRGLSDVRLAAAPIEYAGARAALLVVRDETAERRIEAELRRNETQLDSVLEATSDGILLLAHDRERGTVQMTNRAFLEIFELRAPQVLGASRERLVEVLRDRGHGAGGVADLLEGDAERTARVSIALGADGVREIDVHLRPLRDRAGNAIGQVLACRDLTEQEAARRRVQEHAEQIQLAKVQLEEAYRELDEANRNLRQRTEQLDVVNQELRTLDEMKSNLLGNVSHELQTPLVSVRGYTEMLLKERLGPVNAEQRKGLELCLRNVDRLIGLIDNLLAFSRGETEGARLALSDFPLRPLIDEAVEVLRDRIEARRLSCSVELEEPGVVAHADRDRILQVFLNLLSNAVKYNRDGGSIQIRTGSARRGFVLVQIEDTGIGVASDDQERIFERRFRAAGAGDGGSGYGLAIVRDVLRLHGCRIGVESHEGQGARFHFTLPVRSDLGREEGRAGPPDEPDEPDRTREPASAADVPAAQAGAAEPPGNGARANGAERARPRFRVIRRDRDQA